MAKTKISEFSTTPGNNTDINGINISEGCAPSGINNAIRELMSDLKEWQSGAMDVYVIPQGTAAAPGIQLYGDLDTGLYGFAANQLGVAVGGASAGYFSSAGWVGNVNGTITGDINATTIDTTNLEVTNIKAKDGTAAITIANSTGVVSVSTTLDLTTVEVTNIKAKDGTAAIALTDSTGVVTLARTTSATNSVNEMLVLEHYSTGTISAGFGSGIKFFGENTSGGNSVYAAIHAVWEGGIGDPSGGALVFLTDGYVGDNTERVRITSEGKVGIGTATPSTTLEVSGSATVTGATTLSATTQNIALGTSQTTGTWTAGGASQTGALTLDQSTKTHTLNLGTGATESGLTKTVNIGTGGVSTSTTAINIGSANGTSTTLNGTVTAATLNSTTIDTTNIEVTNIKAKDGSASATIADSTGVMTIASSVLTTTDINGGTIDGTTIGGSTAAAGTFTTATATTGNITTVNATTVDTTNIEVTNIKAKDGTAALSIADSTGVVSVSANPVLSGGTANGVLYLNASKVATSGTALVFDGSKLTVSATSGETALLTATGVSNYLSVKGDTGGTTLWAGFGTDTGLTWVGSVSNHSFSFRQNNTEGMRLVTGGKLNIGGNFTSTNNTLQVTGNAAIGYTTAAPTTGLIVAGNVGVGTSSPGAKLDVNGQIRAYYTGGFQVDNAGSMLGKMYYNGGLVIDRAASTSLLFQQNGSLQMTLDSSGNLGLGTDSPAGRLSVNVDASTQLITFRDSSGRQIWAHEPGGNARPLTIKAQTLTYADDTATRLTVDASGNLVVGNTSALGKLDIGLSGTARRLLVTYDDSLVTVKSAGSTANPEVLRLIGDVLQFNTGTVGSGTERARITSGGYFKASNAGTYFNSTGTYHELRQTANAQVVTVSATNASFTSESIFSTATKTAGTDWMHFYGTSDGNTVANIKIFGNGNVQNANNSYAGISDQKLKQDIVDAGSQWDDIKNLQVRKYRFKASPNAPLQIGLVAQEAETVSPGLVEETVDRDSEGNDLGTTTKAVKYSVLYMKAIKALQEAMARIEKLEAEVAALKGV